MSRVYVVSCNDFPDAVFTSAKLAHVYCKREVDLHRAKDERDGRGMYRRVHYHFTDFELLDQLPEALPKL